MIYLDGLDEFLLSEYEWSRGCPNRQEKFVRLMAAVRENKRLRAELDDLRRDFAQVAGVDLPETGENGNA